MTPDFKDVALIIKLVEEKSAGYEMKVENALTTIYQRGKEAHSEAIRERVEGMKKNCELCNGQYHYECPSGQYDQALDDILALLTDEV